MAKLKMKSTVIEQKMIADGICSMWLDAKEIAVQAKPGQFISVYSNDKSVCFQDQSVSVKLTAKRAHFVLYIV